MKNFIYYLLLLTTTWGFMTTAALAQCPVNTNINSNTNANGATVNWDAVAGAMQYELRYREVGTSALSYASTTTNSFIFTNLQSNICYEFAVRTVCDSTDIGSWSPGQSFCVPGSSGFCAIPSNITSAPTANSATLNWTAITGAQTYEIRYRKIGTSALSFATTTTNSLILTGLMSSTCYEFSMRTSCGTNNFSPWIRPAQNFCTTPGAQPCIPPMNVNATPRPNAALLSWMAVSNAIGYEVRYREVGTSALTYATTNSNSLSLNNLLPNTCYEFSVRTQCDTSDFSPWLIPAQSFCVPGSSGFCATPSAITSTPAATTAQLNWMAMANAQGYEIRYREIGTSALSYAYPTGNSTVLSGLMPNTCYEFSIRTQCDTNNFSPWLSPAESFCTDTMTILPCTIPMTINDSVAGPNGTLLYWSTVAGAQGYEIRYREIGTSVLNYVFSHDSNEFLFNLMDGTCYEYSIRTVCDSSAGDYSPWLTPARTFCTDSIIMNAPCAIPMTINDSVAGPNGTLLYWSTVAGAQGYEIRYREIGTSVLNYVFSPDSNEFLFNLMDGTCYEYSIRTVCDSFIGNYSPWTADMVFCTDTLPCTPPNNVVDSVGTTSAFLTWNGNNSANLGYEIRYIDFNSGNPNYTFVRTNFPSVFLSNLQHATCYTYSIRSVCDSVAGNYSSWTADDFFCTDTLDCTPPFVIRTDSTTTNSAYVSWSNNNSPVAGYEVRYTPITSSSYTTITTSNPMAVIQNLQAGTCYAFSVRTLCNYRGPNENSVWSDSIHFCTNFPSCSIPTNLGEIADTSSAFLDWANVSGAQGYEIRYRQVGTTALSYASSSSSDGFLFNLMPGTCYEYSVRTLCDSIIGNYSPWLTPGRVFCTDTIALSYCAMPSNISQDSSGTHAVILSWTGNASANFGYEIRYRTMNSSNYTVVTTNSTDIFINLLQGQTCYEYNIRSVCDTINPNYSAWTTNDTFCTDLLPCTTPSNIIIDSIGDNVVHFYWDNLASASGYIVRYRQSNPNMPYTYDTVSYNDNNHIIYNLTSNTCYEFEVQRSCPIGSSNWSSIQSFCTDSVSYTCARPTNTFMVVNPTFGWFNWNRVVGATGYEVRFRLLGSNNPYNVLYSHDTTEIYQGFQPGACYEYNVRTRCDTVSLNNYTYSFWSIQDTFCTPTMRLDDPNGTSTTVDDFHSVTKGNEDAPIRYTLFPNPTTGQVTIKFDQALTTAYTVRVFNVLGAEVTPATLERGEEKCTLNLSSVTNGLYMIEVSTAKQRWTEQIQVYR
ncbi:MAG: fibronectin type III domain-containing protein [Aureispira sp.]